MVCIIGDITPYYVLCCRQNLTTSAQCGIRTGFDRHATVEILMVVLMSCILHLHCGVQKTSYVLWRIMMSMLVWPRHLFDLLYRVTLTCSKCVCPSWIETVSRCRQTAVMPLTCIFIYGTKFISWLLKNSSTNYGGLQGRVLVGMPENGVRVGIFLQGTSFSSGVNFMREAVLPVE